MFGFAHRPVARKQGPVTSHSARFQETNQAFRFGKKGSIYEFLISFKKNKAKQARKLSKRSRML